MHSRSHITFGLAGRRPSIFIEYDFAQLNACCVLSLCYTFELWRTLCFSHLYFSSLHRLYANIHPGDAGIVVGDLLVVRHPRGEMDMLVLRFVSQAWRDEHVVELLSVHVE